MIAFFGAALSLCLFAWISLGCDLAICPVSFWLNVPMFVGFTLLHSLAAGRMRRDWYLVVNGLYIAAMIVFWAPSGAVFWNGGRWISLAVMTIFVAWLAAIPASFTQFFGFRPTPNAALELRTGGLYSYVRHPMYTITLAALALGPYMTFDRMIILGLTVSYLIWAIPYEEGKLVRLYGRVYEDFQDSTPYVIIPGVM